VKYEYNGLPQKIVPLTTEQFAILLETLLKIKNREKISLIKNSMNYIQT